MGNAVKFTNQGFVRIEIAAASDATASPLSVALTVSDTGCGIPKDKLSNIFEPFVQADRSHARRLGGVGLGLAIVRRLTELMGGEIAVESVVGQGTVIRVVLPLRLAPVRPAQDSPLAVPALDRRLRILLAEDDETNAFVTRRLLEKAGHTLTACDNGACALDLIAAKDFDLVLMDIQMPVMGGVEAVQRLRDPDRFGAKAGIPVIAMTAYAMVGDRERLLAAGMDGYVAKPVEVEELAAVMAQVLEKKGRGERAGQAAPPD